MSFKLTWLPAVLRGAGLKVAEVEGWENRGLGEMGDVAGVMCHHTATARRDLNMPTLKVLIDGRSDLPGPLSQLGLGRDGTYYVIAAGRCNHAGAGKWEGITTGNSSFIGIEAENSGKIDDPWPAVQIDAYQCGVAAILMKLGRSEQFCVGHREYATPAGRKIDPNFSMDVFRQKVKGWINGTEALPQLIPAFSPAPDGNGSVQRPTLRRFDTGKFVKEIQEKLKLEVDGFFGPRTEARVRAFQRDENLVPDGIVGPKTWLALDKLALAA